MVWAVFAPTANVAPGHLAGHYAGVTASGAVGVGANVLVGGSGNHIMLQPLSIGGQTGLNVAAGIAALQLTSEKAEKESGIALAGAGRYRSARCAFPQRQSRGTTHGSVKCRDATLDPDQWRGCRQHLSLARATGGGAQCVR